jgi:hypothetical protein
MGLDEKSMELECEKCHRIFSKKRSFGSHKSWCLHEGRKSWNTGKIGECKSLSNGVKKSWENFDIRKRHCEGMRRKDITYIFCKKCGKEIKSGDYCRGHAPKLYCKIWNSKILHNGPNKEMLEKAKQTRIENPIKQSDVSKKKKSETIIYNHLMFGLTEKELARGKKISEKKMGHEVTNETREKISFTVANTPVPVKTKHYYSEKNKEELYYHSLYELEAFYKLEKSLDVKSYDRCRFSIPYEWNGCRRYVPDISILYQDGKQEIVEVKPNFRLVEERTKAKIEAAEKFCESKGMGFSVWTEDHIFGKEVV